MGYWVYPPEHVGGVIVCHKPVFYRPQRGDRLWGMSEVFEISYFECDAPAATCDGQGLLNVFLAYIEE